jgi:AcrR family transcriptional regulator
MIKIRRSPSTERGTATYEALLRAGASVFSRRGFRQASVAEICRRSRVANGTFYQYFPDKEQIFLTLIERLAYQLQTRLQASVAPTASAIEQLQSALRTHLKFIESQTALYRVFRLGFIKRSFKPGKAKGNSVTSIRRPFRFLSLGWPSSSRCGISSGGVGFPRASGKLLLILLLTA